ncbi:MAG TPA: GNAT family N-acetyltransferase [Solirubrobacterales bacterium]|nr:GNAT family N-acetyltransferase [Solirubrobacterales bacterium]
MADPTAADLYDRQLATLLASWEANARGCADAAVLRPGGVAAAVFPTGAERDVYNNAVLARGLGPDARAVAVAAMESAYAAAGVGHFAAWTDDGDAGMQAELTGRGYAIAETTRVMAMSLDDFDPLETDPVGVVVGPAPWAMYLKYLHGLGLPEDLLAGVDAGAYRVVAARVGEETVATGLAFEHDGDCGIFNVSTLEPFRRRGIAAAVTARLIAAARTAGCTTASLQSTPIAEGVYARLGFRYLGRFLEFAAADRP